MACGVKQENLFSSQSSPRRAVGSAFAAAGMLAAVLVLTGCGNAGHLVGAEKEAEEQAQFRREDAMERRVAHNRAVRLERAFDVERQPMTRPTVSCRLKVPPSRPHHGIVPVSCGSFGSAWPLTVEWGYLRCEPSIKQNFERVVFTAPDGIEYAVNRSAYGVGYPGIRPLRRKHTNGMRANIGILVSRGLSLCD
jgi:hypothetical protein